MTEYHFLPGTSEKLTHEILSQLGFTFKLNGHKDGYTISTANDNSKLFGYYDGNQIRTFYPTRSIGNWKEILKVIDSMVLLEMYDDDFNYMIMDIQCHGHISDDKLLKLYAENIDKCRKTLNLPKIQR